MDSDSYSIAQLLADMKSICAEHNSEREILSAMRPLARRAALSKSTWLTDAMWRTDPEQGFGVHLLHEEPDHTMAIFAVSWLPSRGAPPHDHGTWAVIAGVDGPEKNEFYRRTDDGSQPGRATLKKVGETLCGHGDVVAIPSGMIHSVLNETASTTVSLHLYGKHINYTGRSQFDLASGTEKAFILKVEQ